MENESSISLGGTKNFARSLLSLRKITYDIIAVQFCGEAKLWGPYKTALIAALHRQVRRAAVDCGAANRRQLELWRRTTC